MSKNTRAEDNLPRPDIGFFGRDETLLALDRAFDTQSIVLLHAYAGSGKTMTAAEFARWYAQTGGLCGRRALRPYCSHRSSNTNHWNASLMRWSKFSARAGSQQHPMAGNGDEDRMKVTLQIFQQIPALWIWDNVEPVNGFPSGRKIGLDGADSANCAFSCKL